jgi:diguanylate cyclase (GGDEF)-like protein/PAS domain S-box-containing protein
VRRRNERREGRAMWGRVKPYRPHLFVACVLALTLITGLHEPLRNALTALRFDWLRRDASGDVVLVAIDAPSLKQAGVWPWPRTMHATLLDVLDGAGATDIVFDVDFSAASAPDADRAFAEALRRAGGSVVLPAFKQVAREHGASTILVDRPLPLFAPHTWWAAINIVPDPDGVVRRYAFGEMLDGKFVPSVGALLAGRYEAGGSMLIDFGIRRASVPTLSYIDVLRRDPAAMRTLHGRKIIVGATAIELGDRVNVPNGQVIPGAMLQALAAESVLQGRALQPAPAAVALGGAAALMLAMLVLWRRCSGPARFAALLGLAVAAEAGAILLQAWRPVVLDTSIFHAAILAYLVAVALDEIDLRGLLGGIAEKRFARIAMSIGDGLVCVNEAGRITLWNPGAEAIFGSTAAEMTGQPFEAIFGAALARMRPAFALSQLRPDSLQAPGGKVIELEGARKSGEIFPFEACFSAWQGADGLQYGVVLRDISARRREEERIRYLATYDSLTGLPNRNTLYEHLDAELRAARDAGSEVALLTLDLDKFKDINDSLGHVFGDNVLSEVAARVKTLVADDGLVARLGGDEFAVVVASADVADRAEKLSVKISDSFGNDPFVLGGHRFVLKGSVGVSLFPRDCDEVQQMLGNADLAMYRAKTLGHGAHVFFDASIRDELERRLSLTAELELAFARGEFELFYQPQFMLDSGELVGAEALIRWHHPVRGLVTPGEFIDVLNTTSVADATARWVLAQACRQGRRWQEMGYAIRIGVNLTPAQVETGDLPFTVATILAETGLSPQLLELEVTEHILLPEDDERSCEIFRRLRDLGVRIAFDDFGTGYASLSYLKKFPLNRLKIDQSFVRELKPDSSDAAIVESTIGLCNLLGLSVIAEGIEDAATIDWLRQMGCDEGQGYYFARPMPPAQLEKSFFAQPEIPQVAVADQPATAA